MRTDGAVGEVVAGRYRLDAPLGRGGMGVVWRAADLVLGRDVAVKRLRAQPGLDAEQRALARDRTLREARIAAALDHPALVRIFDVLVDDEDPVLVLEFVPSRALDAVGVLAPADAARIGADVAAALAAAHAAGVVHRDIKPSNVLLLDSPRNGVVAKLTDFGISHAADAPELTATGELSGTPAYFAPEIARGGAGGPPADVYSLGATLHTALTGRPPFGSGEGNVLALIARIASGNAPPPAVEGPLGPLVQRLTADDPTARPTAAQARDALWQLASTQGPVEPVAPVDPPTVDPPTEVLDGRGRRRTRIIALVAVSVLAVGAAIAVALTYGRAPSAAPPSATDTAGTSVRQATGIGIGDPDTADPCDLMPTSALNPFGAVTLRPNEGRFSSCAATVADSAGRTTVSVTFAERPRSGGTTRSARGAIDIRSFSADCLDVVELPNGMEIEIAAAGDGDRCSIVSTTSAQVAASLLELPVDRRESPMTTRLLGAVSACRLLTDEEVAAALATTDASLRPGFGNWSCSWTGDGETTILVEFLLSLPGTPSGVEQPVGRRTGYVDQRDDSCRVTVPVGGPDPERVENLEVSVYGGAAGDACTDAGSLATAAEARLPAP